MSARDRFGGPPRMLTIHASPAAAAAAFIRDRRFVLGFLDGAYFTVGAAYVWSFYL